VWVQVLHLILKISWRWEPFMRLTETQRNFRREMAKIKDNDNNSIYDYHLNRRKHMSVFSRRNALTIGTVITIVSLAFTIIRLIPRTHGGEVYFAQGSSIPLTPITSNGIESSLTQQNIVNQPGRMLSLQEGQYLKSLNEIFEAVDAETNIISDYNRTPWNARDLNGYRQALSSGTDICNSAETSLNTLTPPLQFQNINNLALSSIADKAMAFSCWSQASYGYDTVANEEADAGNSFSIRADSEERQYLISLKDYLSANGYEYESDGNGGIIYHYSAS